MQKNTRIPSRNFAGNAAALPRPSAQSNLFGQKNSTVNQPSHGMQTRSQTSMLILGEGTSSGQKHYLNQPSGDLRGSPKQHLIGKPASKKGSKVKIAPNHGHRHSEPASGGVSARSTHQHGMQPAPGYSTKTFYSNYIGANSSKNTTGPNSQASSFVKKSRNNSYSTINAGQQPQHTATGVPIHEMKASQTQAHLIANGMAGGYHRQGMVGSSASSQAVIQQLQAANSQSSMTISSSRMLSNLQERMINEGGNGTKSGSKAATAAVAAARVNANISAAAQQNVQKLAVPDLAHKLMKTQMSLDLKGLSKIAQQQKTRATHKAQKSSRASLPQNKVSIVLNNQQWEQVQPGNGPHHELIGKHEYSMRSISRKRQDKGVKKLTSRDQSINSVLQDKHLVDDKNDTITKKKALVQLQTSMKGGNSSGVKRRVGLQNELLATLNLKNYQKGLLTQQLSAQNSQRAIVSPKQGMNHSFKFNNTSAVHGNSQSLTNFEGLTPKQTSKVFQRVHNRKTDSKLRNAGHVSNMNAETTNCSYNQYGIVEGGTSSSLGNHHVLQGYPGASGAHTGYMTSLGHNSPDMASPLISGNQSQINYRHTRVQSNIVDSFNARVASQSALGLASNLGGQSHLGQTQQPKARGSLPANTKTKKGPTQQQQIQEKIRQLQKDQALGGGSGSGGHTKNLVGRDRNVMSVISQINKRVDLQNQSSLGNSTKKLSSRAAIHKSAQQMHENSSTQKVLQEKLIKKAQDKLGGRSLNQNQIRESKTTKDLHPIRQNSSSVLAMHQQQSQSALSSKQRVSVAKKRNEEIGPNGKPLTQIELVGVYKFTRNQAKHRKSDAALEPTSSSSNKKVTGVSRNKIGQVSAITTNPMGRYARAQEYQTQQKASESNVLMTSSTVKSSNPRPASHMRQRIDKAYKQFCDNESIQHSNQQLLQTSNANVSAQQLNYSATKTASKAKGSSKQQKAAMLAAAQKEAQLAAERKQQKQMTEESEQHAVATRKRVGKSASLKRKRQGHTNDEDQIHSHAALLHAATRQRFKEDAISDADNTEHDETIGELGVQSPQEIEYSKRKRREVSEPPRFYQSVKMQKMFNEADLIVLEDRSNSRVRSFKIFDDKRVFPEIYEKDEFQPLDKEEKHDECDYDTEPEHVVKARELMLEDLTESIKFYVEEQPLDLVYNINKKYK